jgi:methionyl-tRNA synthetase
LNIAGEERVIVSGLVPFYSEEELLGKRVIVAYNLKAAKLRGVESRGMLLAASIKEGGVGGNGEEQEIVEALDAAGVETGTRVPLEGASLPADVDPPVIDIDTFFSVPVTVKDGVVNVNGKAFLLNGKKLVVRRVLNGEVH